MGATTISIANNPNSPISQISNHSLFLDTEPEPVGGSTRMNAGTAQKICLDLLMNGIVFGLGMVSQQSLDELVEYTPSYKSNSITNMKEFLMCLLNHERQSIKSIGNNIEALVPAVECVARQLGDKQGNLLVAGAGTTARAMVQEQAELYPTFGFSLGRTKFGIAGGNEALLRDYHELTNQDGASDNLVKKFEPTNNDVCLLGSVSGNTKFTNYLAEKLKATNTPTIGFCNSAEGKLLRLVDIPVLLKTSNKPGGKLTRLGAGTAHKVALNIITTSAMILMGHVYDGYMIDVKLFCEKLVQRATRMVSDLSGSDEQSARASLELTAKEKFDWSVTKAVLHQFGILPGNFEQFIREKGKGKSSVAIEAAKSLNVN